MFVPRNKCIGLALCCLFLTTFAVRSGGSDSGDSYGDVIRSETPHFPPLLGTGRSSLPLALRPLDAALRRAELEASQLYERQRRQPGGPESYGTGAITRLNRYPFHWPPASIARVNGAVRDKPRLARLWVCIRRHHTNSMATLAEHASRALELVAPLYQLDMRSGLRSDRLVLHTLDRLAALQRGAHGSEPRRDAVKDSHAARAALESIRDDVNAGRLRLGPRSRGHLQHIIAGTTLEIGL